MNEKKPSDTRARILDTALDLFSERGYEGTSMREIANRLEITKATVFYHFPSKAVLLATLTEPISEELEEVLDRALLIDDPVDFRRALIEGTLDVFIRNRKLLHVIPQDMTMLSRDGSFERIIVLLQRIHDAFAGPNPDVAVRIRAVQIFAMLGDPVFLCGDVPVGVLRAEILAGVWALLDDPATSGLVTRQEAGLGPRTPPPAQRRPGRPSVMDGAKADLARRMHAEGVHSVGEIAERLGVSRATVYRHLRAGDAPRP